MSPELLCFNFGRKTLNKSAFCGEPARVCDAGISQIKVLAPLILPQKFLHLFNQRFHRSAVLITTLHPWTHLVVSDAASKKSYTTRRTV
jgi:hypothetical protein